MSIINREKTAARPLFRLPELRLNDIQNDRHPVLIVRAHHSSMRIGSICDNHAVLFLCELGRVVNILKSLDLVFLHLNVLSFLSRSHFHASVLHDLDIVRINKHHCGSVAPLPVHGLCGVVWRTYLPLDWDRGCRVFGYRHCLRFLR